MEKTIENGLEKLEQILKDLESGEKTLEESFALYKQGMELVKFCNEKIDRVEKQLILLNGGEENGQPD